MGVIIVNNNLIFEIEQFKKDLQDSINSVLQRHSHIPIYFIEPTMINIATQITNEAKRELQQAQLQQQKEQEVKENET